MTVALKTLTDFAPQCKIDLWTTGDTVGGVAVDCTRTELGHVASWNTVCPCLVADGLAVPADCDWLQAG